ncbi:head GIN domain-containing protein [Flammeovirga kamogawensis]|uniref:DUF2807 domain-containing protein n=1 Tax=Flammeovirga kamogawensis TaxID=373891 RepID=A0ABX8GZF2_9BACT|nr:head GIN domain-containing protein [Flammeovirga kamogawensis]MBB6459364.1 hypothetical protein [Flammeovirga kamogawensis]QWG08921.1 DUF2807 domain-containing protein [Flammeovirga kamogawensis]TRX67212.1 DUF2807 domain-containing protein [Flammeovirga kamogawensis]
MNYKFIISTLLLLFTTFLYAQEETTRSLDNFKKIKISGSFDVEISHSNENTVTIIAHGKTKTTDIITEITNGKLSIYPRKGVRNVNADIIITYTEKLSGIGFSGSSDIRSKGLLETDDIGIAGSGSGSFKGEINANSIETSLSGSGELYLKGNANNLSISVSGSADIDTKELEAKIVTISVSGSGDVDCFATEEITARVSGSGDIRYKGQPSRTKIKVSGSGDIEQIN